MELKEMKPGRTYLVKYHKYNGKQGPSMTSKRITLIKLFGNQIYGYVLNIYGQAKTKEYFPIRGIKSIQEVRFSYE